MRAAMRIPVKIVLVPLIETGPGKDSDCAQLTASIKSTARAAEAAPGPDHKRRGPAS